LLGAGVLILMALPFTRNLPSRPLGDLAPPPAAAAAASSA
jgi:hypothetical protein